MTVYSAFSYTAYETHFVKGDRNSDIKYTVSDKLRKNAASWHCLLTAVHKIRKKFFSGDWLPDTVLHEDAPVPAMESRFS